MGIYSPRPFAHTGRRQGRTGTRGSTNPHDYIALCARCHRAIDAARRSIVKGTDVLPTVGEGSEL